MRNESRSLNAGLDEGSTDGKYLKARPNAGGQVESATEANRRGLHPSWNYGTFAEAPVMVRPDGRVATHER